MVKRAIMEELLSRLNLLKEQEKKLKESIDIDMKFSSEDEYNLFVQKNKDAFIQLKNLKKEIKELEWKLMTDKEKEEHLRYLEDLKNKFKDE